MVFGKNTMIRRCLRNLNKDEEHPEYDQIVNVMKGNLGFVFTNEDLADILDVLKGLLSPRPPRRASSPRATAPSTR